jgi:hypothetical protein
VLAVLAEVKYLYRRVVVEQAGILEQEVVAQIPME